MWDFLIAELEIARSRVDMGESMAKLCREQLKECEELSIKVTEAALNKKLGHAEYFSENFVRERLEIDGERPSVDGNCS